MKIFCIFMFLNLTISHSISHSKTLTWNEASLLAQQNNLEYQAALANYKSTEDLETSGISGFLPKINASVTSSQNYSEISNANTQSYSAQLSLTQNLFSGFTDINTYFFKKTTTQQALATLNSVKAKLSQELKQSFSEAYYIQDYKKLVTDILNRRTENKHNVKLQYDVGRENKGSLLLAESYVDLANYDVLKALHDEDIFKDNLKRLLGLNSNEAITILENIPKEILKNDTPDFNSIAQQHPDVLIAQYEESILFSNLKINRGQFLPSLDLSGNYGYAGTQFFPDQNKWSVGLTLSIPLFEGFKTISTYRSSRSKFEGQQYTAKNVLSKTINSLKQSYYDYLESVHKEKIDSSFVNAAVLRAEVARNKYKNGFLNFEAWDLVETDLILRQKEMLSSEKNRIVKQSLWERAQGVGVFK